MKNVKTRILAVICTLVAVSLLTLGVVSILLNYQTTNGILNQTMQETAVIAADRVSAHLDIYKTVVEGAGLNPVICSPTATPEEKQAALDDIVSENPDFTRGNILDAAGTSIFNDTNYSDRDYYQSAIKGVPWVSEPLVSRVTGAVTIIVAAPIWQNGLQGTAITGVVYLVPVESFLNDITKSIKVSPNAGAQMLNKSGTIIAHPEMEYVANLHNNQELSKEDPSYKSIAAIESKMIKGETGFGSYKTEGISKFIAYAPIPGTDGWSIGVNAPTKDFMSYTATSIIFTIALLAFFLIVSGALAAITAKRIGLPLNYLSDILSNIAKTGSIKLDDDHRNKEKEMLKRKDEIGQIAAATDGLLSMLVHDAEVLNTIANGDLTVDISPLSDDDVLGTAMLKMTSSLNRMFSDINHSSIQVSSGARQIANGSQTLAQGSTEQAAAVQQLSSSMTQIAEKTRTNAEMADRAAHLANSIMGNAEKGSQQMSEMMEAVREINEASHSISKVIKVIDDIAFQTNILALNAAVEAARAGQHGKGFAVVAEEVRSLAAKSAEAAKDTGGLIANSIEKAEFGARIADDTAISLSEIVAGINESTMLVGDIAKSSEEQSAGISQINKGIEQVAQVVQQNSATAEQSAAASHQMSGQSDVLQNLVAQFKIKDNSHISTPAIPSTHTQTPVNTKYSQSADSLGKY